MFRSYAYIYIIFMFYYLLEDVSLLQSDFCDLIRSVNYCNSYNYFTPIRLFLFIYHFI